MTSERHKEISAVVEDIRSLRDTVEQLLAQFRLVIDRRKKEQDRGGQSGIYWMFVAYTDSLVRIRLFLEQNFKYIEPMGLLAVTRYLFEVTVWLKLMQQDNKYGLVYYRRLIVDQLKYYRALQEHLNREVTFFGDIEQQEKKLTEEQISNAAKIPDEEIRKEAFKQVAPSVMKDIDHRASLRFSIYGQEAQINGYGFQAYLIKTKVIPSITKAIADIEKELSVFDSNIPQDVTTIIAKTKRWVWRDQAKLIHMEDEYDFIYSYTSRLLHATPASLTTNQKNLEPDEILVFLKYVHVRLIDAIQIARQLLSKAGTE